MGKGPSAVWDIEINGDKTEMRKAIRAGGTEGQDQGMYVRPAGKASEIFGR